MSELERIEQGQSEYTSQKKRLESIISGWDSVETCAADVWNSQHRVLLSGELIFAYRGTNTKSDLQQLIIVKNLPKIDSLGEIIPGSERGYAVGIVTTAYSALYPEVPMCYLENDVICDLEKYKVDKVVVNTYRESLEAVKEKYEQQ